MPRSALGKIGEVLGQEILLREGYQILEANYRYARAEVDVVAWEGEILAFVEIKTRQRGTMINPEQAVDRHKRSRIVNGARHYLYTRRIRDTQCRFDVLSIYADERGWLIRYDLFRDAFVARGGNYF